MRMGWRLLIATSLVAGVACQGKFGSTDEHIVPPPSPRPTYGPTVSLPKSPPAISGGTLRISHDNSLAIAADPDRDRVMVADLASGAVSTIALSPGDDPGRVVEDDSGRAHVVLRGGGSIATIDLASRTLVSRRAVCAAPRGIAWRSASKQLFLACAGGEVVSIDGDAPPKTIARLDRDLRDIVADSALHLTRFRSAELIELTLTGESRIASVQLPPTGSATPEVAWRMVGHADGRLAIVHQRARAPGGKPISTSAGGYSDGSSGSTSSDGTPIANPCKLGIVQSAVSLVQPGGSILSLPPISNAVLPVDIAIGSGSEVAVVAAGNGHTPELPQIFFLDPVKESFGPCVTGRKTITPTGQAIAAAFADTTLVVQTREPAALLRYSTDGTLLSTIALGGESREDTGHAVFHSNAGGFMACASCHPEGGDDGHVWAFDGVGPRRTQNLRGGLKGTEPFHWDGDLPDLHALMGEVFTKRMSGAPLSTAQLDALAQWVEAIPHIPRSMPADAAAVARGKALFDRPASNCGSCHAGPKLTNHQTVDVGTGMMQVPSLTGVAFRAPFMHTGCANTLADRFSPECGGAQHGYTSGLTVDERRDLIAYLETL